MKRRKARFKISYLLIASLLCAAGLFAWATRRVAAAYSPAAPALSAAIFSREEHLIPIRYDTLSCLLDSNFKGSSRITADGADACIVAVWGEGANTNARFFNAKSDLLKVSGAGFSIRRVTNPVDSVIARFTVSHDAGGRYVELPTDVLVSLLRDVKQ